MTVQTQKRRWPLYAGLAAGLLVVVAGAAVAGILVARGDNATAAPSPSTSPSAAAEDRHGIIACELLRQAMDEDRIAEPLTVSGILEEAKQSGDFGVRFEAQMLSDQRKIAERGDAADKIRLHTQAIKMQTACVKAGLAS